MQGEKKAEKDDKLSSSLPWIHGETRFKKNSKVTCRKQERYTTRNAFKTPYVGFIWPRHKKNAQHFGKQNRVSSLLTSAARFYRENDISER